jgi:predicted transposase/invertase (TIGR01784 family)
MQEYKYINPFTDYGFKLLFGTEANKDLLIDFLNCAFLFESPIVDITFKNVEQIPVHQDERKAIFDLYCVDNEGNRFIIEMQKAKLIHFRDRAVYYSTFPISTQAPKGKWDFNLRPVYHLAILDFFYENEEEAIFERNVQLKDQDNKVFYKKLWLKFLQMPAFKKELVDLQTRFDHWCYFLQQLETFDIIPALFKLDEKFQKMLNIAEIANLPADEVRKYRASRIKYDTFENFIESAFADGEQAGIEKMTLMLEQERKEKEQAELLAKQERKEKEQAELLAKQERENHIISLIALVDAGVDKQIIATANGMTLEDLEELLDKT